MKYLLIFVIRLYQILVPEKLRGQCLFNESCSNHVLATTRTRGFKSGLKALRYRYVNCRRSYTFVKTQDQLLLITCTGDVVTEDRINEQVIDHSAYDMRSEK